MGCRTMNTGDILVSSLSSLVSDYSEMISKYLANPNDSRRQVRLTIERMVDDLLTENMNWVERVYIAEIDRYLDMLILDNLSHQDRVTLNSLIDNLISEIFKCLDNMLTLPTWFMVTVKFPRCNNLMLQIGEDYRIVDWMRQHESKNGKERRRRRRR